MRRTPRTKRRPRDARSLPACLRQFLTPAVWKQAQHGLRKPRKDARWNFHHLILVLLALTWSLGDSTPERFEMARGIVALCRPKRRRAGRTAVGFQKALVRLPLRPVVALAAAVRRRLLTTFGAAWVDAGWIPLGCDGSRLECPRNDELLARLGTAGKADSAPTLWVTALVHLTTGVPWSWWLGKGNASERNHLRRLIPTLPARALVIADAGYHGYDLAAAITAAGGSFLIRMCSKVHLFVDQPIDPQRFEQGAVLYWPHEARQKQRPPLRLRLIRIRGRRRVQKGRPRPVDVWLLTDVPDTTLSRAQAARFYRLRWENEGLFRTYKRTLSKVQLVGRTVRAVHREAYGSLLACQLLLAQGAWALRPRHGATPDAAEPCSARQALLVVRAELVAAMRPDRHATYRDRLGRCRRERRERTSTKQKRQWPRRTPHKPPKPPKVLTMNDEEKALLYRLDAVA
jgi:Transposase DDE domain